ncbi:hypothetical protein N7533_000586 [Penicillium manginii]|jgi:hypothetical protein|uniref:uncharacterized protein n=1 Tax=Penicillium manginii TaxID=203109 RepID=UPI0025480788|nr:uncharacterized protein N7533_000586 [Penicillium manginii]KAJ5768003.1 hypothetical protein N7533_000586 [Penicillium manginii]
MRNTACQFELSAGATREPSTLFISHLHDRLSITTETLSAETAARSAWLLDRCGDVTEQGHSPESTSLVLGITFPSYAAAPRQSL